MPLTRIEVEQLSGTRWVAEVEIGGISARRRHIVGQDFDDVMTQIYETYRAHYPEDQTTPASVPQQPVDPKLVPAMPEAPVGRKGASKMRKAADDAVAARDPDYTARAGAMRGRRF